MLHRLYAFDGLASGAPINRNGGAILDKQVIGALTDDERTMLAQCERVIERGLATFIEVGEALLTVRDARLYRVSYPTFEDYCRERWELSRPRAYQLIDAAGTVHALSTNVDTPPPANEAQARELAPLAKESPEQAAEAWTEAYNESDGKPTAKKVREKVEAKKPVTVVSPIDEDEDNDEAEAVEVAVDRITASAIDGWMGLNDHDAGGPGGFAHLLRSVVKGRTFKQLLETPMQPEYIQVTDGHVPRDGWPGARLVAETMVSGRIGPSADEVEQLAEFLDMLHHELTDLNRKESSK